MDSKQNDFQSVAKDYFSWQLASRKPEDLQECRDILNDVISNITLHYDILGAAQTKKLVSKNTSLWTSLLVRKTSQQGRLFQTLSEALKDHLIRKFKHCNQSIQHVEVYKQFVPNLCGYHASYNLLEIILCAKYGQTNQIRNGTAFWSYVVRTQKFLTEYSIKFQLDRNAWPWRKEDIAEGDFERTYWKVCLSHNNFMNSTFVDENVQGINYKIRQATVYYQYDNLVFSQSERHELEQRVQEFRSFVPNDNTVLILGCMLGITNHWISFVAQKSIAGMEFFVFDSRNRDYFEWNQAQMKQWLEEENANRKRTGREEWNQFYLSLHLQGMKDQQQCVRLMVELLSGACTIDTFASNSRMRVFLNDLVNVLAFDDQEFLQVQVSPQNIKQIYEQFNTWATGYYHTVKNYQNSKPEGITLLNQQVLQKTIEIGQACLKYQRQKQIQEAKNRIETVLQYLNNIYRNI